MTEGGHLAYLELFGKAIAPMTKTTFYFVIGILAITDVVQSRYRKKLLRLGRPQGSGLPPGAYSPSWLNTR